MYRLTNFQLYCLMVMLVVPIAFLEQPKRLILLVEHNAWLACIAVIIPGFLIINMFTYIIKKSQNPFPYLLEEYFGKIGGKILAFIYIGVFILIASYTLSLFVNFVITNVLPATPISVLIGSLLLVGYYIMKNGFQNFSRSTELIILLGLPVVLAIILLAFTQTINFDHLLPIGYMDYKNFGLAVISISSVLGRIFPILTIAYFSNDLSKLNWVLTMVLFTFAMVILLPTLGVILAFGGTASNMLAFPALSLLRQIDIAQFITNIDIFFIGLWISGTMSAFCIFWFMACFTAQQLFSFKEYSFLSAPSSLIIAVLSLMLAPNIIILEIINTLLVIGVYLVFFLFIPLVIFIMALFKPHKTLETSPEKEKSTVIM
ncbi:MAG: GerAB/ArcD/ProY family transporter [Syntrophomonadaceae bacterium]|nr:GerAB/ArcD/ProY family transporter [Syntrophomonadaceae bacterium]